MNLYCKAPNVRESNAVFVSRALDGSHSGVWGFAVEALNGLRDHT
jgi:hypothetical protein